eukprot:TRINITY_DN1980_c0_g1_i1.p1 TRINITY_DN1980_c0_g1~~TRINITY_DN1980_c0_g1_i1.p1  ORF type:complete len:198 (-),score=47.79 TRINITY_DN1980_c0_g1_i1:99-614(-)
MEPPVKPEITFVTYESELSLPSIMRLMEQDLSEPYSVYTYRYFINNWPKLCWLAMHGEECVGAIVCKLDEKENHKVYRGYIAMLAVNSAHRNQGLGSKLVQKAIQTMQEHGCTEVILETEVTNKGALRLYQKLGFLRDKRLYRYYLNGGDAFRLKLDLDVPVQSPPAPGEK